MKFCSTLSLVTLLAPMAFAEVEDTSISAEDVIEEVLVVGELRDVSVMDVASSISVLDTQSIKNRNAQNLEDVLGLAPNVNYSTGASRGRFIQIRGVGERSQFVAPINPSVGVVVDGIDFTGVSTAVTTLDVQQVEIYRGPQGTLFGANALAGMIYVAGNRPDDEFSGNMSIGAGNYNTFNSSVVINNPLSDKVGWRFGLQKNSSDGYYENTYLDRKDTNNINELGIRNHLTFAVSDTLDLALVSYYLDADNGYDAFSLDNNRTTLSDEPGHDRQTTSAHALHMDFSGFSFADVKAVLSHSDSNTEYGYDEDWSYQNICSVTSDCAFWQYSTTDNYQRDNSNSTLDVRLVSKAQDQAVSWVAGVYTKHQTVDLMRTYTNNFSSDDIYTYADPAVYLFSSDYDTTNSAIYGEVNIQLNDRVNVITGLRYETFTSDYSDSDAFAFSPDDSFWGGKLAVEYTVDSDTLLYALASRGYKTGGFNADADIDEDNRFFEPETMNNFELGLKGSWLDDALVARSTVFYQQRNDVQVKTSLAIPDEAVAGFTFLDYLDNAAAGNNYGLEIETHYQIDPALVLFATVGILETEFKDFINYSHVDRNAETGEGVDMDGHAQPHAPHFQGIAGGEWNVTDTLSFRLDVEAKSSFYFSANHEEKSAAYQLLNLRMNYQLNSVAISIWAKNLSDELVETRGFYFSHDFGNDPRKFYAPEPYTQKGAPRTLGISASVDF